MTRYDEHDDDDEYDEKIRRSLRYSVRLLINHPSIDPAIITDTLGLEPNIAHLAGTPRTTPRGDPLPGVHELSVWSCRTRVERRRLFFSSVVNLLNKLEPHKRFLHRLVDEGGMIDLIVHLPGDVNIGSDFGWRDMARLSALRIDLGIEVFPEFN